MTSFLVISLGAIAGANLRYWLGEWAAVWGLDRFGVALPYGTFLVNVLGSLLLGVLVALLAGRAELSPYPRLLLGVGFLGSFTTFSSFSADTLLLLAGGRTWSALGNVAANNILGILCAFLGFRLGVNLAG
jgi:CrcB protein